MGTSPVPFLVMELLDGETLHQRILRGPLDVPGKVRFSITNNIVLFRWLKGPTR